MDPREPEWLRVPVLQAVGVRVWLPAGLRPLYLEQDGFLRAFDMGTVLWPAGYVLALWTAEQCASLRGARVLELGAGVGAPSAVAARCGARKVLATDASAFARLAAAGNAALDGSDTVAVRRLDWNSPEDVAAARAEGPFDLLLGAGLAPDRWGDRLWPLVAELAPARVAFAHGAGELPPPPPEAGWRLERVPADRWGCRRYNGGDSEFEIVVGVAAAAAEAA